MNKTRLQEKLQAYSQIDSLTNCWEWHGQVSNSGHGKIKIVDNTLGINKIISAERASYLAFVDNISEEMIVRQTCKNRLCINPEHLKVENIPSP